MEYANEISDIFRALKLINQPILKNWLKKNHLIVSQPIIISYTTKSDLFVFIPDEQSATDILSSRNSILLGTRWNYQVYKMVCEVSPKSKWFTGWWYGPLPQFLQQTFLPTTNNRSYIIGPTPKVFISQQQKDIFGTTNPYKSPEGFYATIIHEIGHAIFSEITESLEYTFVNQLPFQPKSTIFYPEKWFLPELFAFCFEYAISKIILPKHASRLEILQKNTIKLLQTNKILPNTKHMYSIAIGITLVQLRPKTWPARLISRSNTVI